MDSETSKTVKAIVMGNKLHEVFTEIKEGRYLQYIGETMLNVDGLELIGKIYSEGKNPGLSFVWFYNVMILALNGEPVILEFFDTLLPELKLSTFV